MRNTIKFYFVLFVLLSSCFRKTNNKDCDYIRNKLWVFQSGYQLENFGNFIDFDISKDIQLVETFILVKNIKIAKIVQINRNKRLIKVKSIKT